MNTTPPEEANPVLLAFQKINTQLEQLEAREIRAEERERKALEREQRLIEQQHKVNGMMLKIVEKANNFQQSMIEVETRTKSHLSEYFKELPKSSTVVHRKEWGFDVDTKLFFFATAFALFIGVLGSYFLTSLSYEEKVSYQRKLIREYEGNIEYLQSKIPVAPAKPKKRKKS
jgi:hypothetical protein